MLALKLGISLVSSNTSVLTPSQVLVNDFEIRVVTDGGVFEAKACLVAQLTILSNIAWVY